MKNSKVLKTILVFLGLSLMTLGILQLSSPVEFYANSGVVLGMGILILLGAFFPTLTFTSTIVSVAIFLSFVYVRLLGIAADGVLRPDIITGIVFELIFGLVSIFAFLKYRKKITKYTT